MQGADAKIKRAYASRLPMLAELSKEWDPHGMFVNDFFKKLLFDNANDDPAKALSSAGEKPPVAIASYQ